MPRDPGPTQHELEMVTLEELVPSDLLLRRIDFSFIRDEVRHLYCEDNGRSALDPVLLFKALFIGYLLRSARGWRSSNSMASSAIVDPASRKA